MPKSYIRAAVSLYLEVTSEQNQALMNHVTTFNKMRNEIAASHYAYNCISYTKMHAMIYRYCREKYPDLTGSNIQQAGRSIAGANHGRFTRIDNLENRYNSCLKKGYKFSVQNQKELNKLKAVKYPVFRSTASTEIIHSEYSVDLNENVFNISVLGHKRNNRLRIKFKLNKYDRDLITRPNTIYRQGKIVYTRDHRWVIRLTILLEVPEAIYTENISEQRAMGVDLGVVNHVATDTNFTLSADKTTKYLNHIKAVNRSLQKKGTKASRRKLIYRRGKQRRYLSDVQHCVARDVVNEARRCLCSILVLEALSGANRPKARKGYAKGIKAWAYDQQAKFITRRAIKEGMAVFAVPAAHTSDTCPVCGHSHKDNRFDRDTFWCTKCGYTANADVNAACNIKSRLFKYNPERVSKLRIGLLTEFTV